MTKRPQAGSFQSQSEEIIREEALKLARATQTPGQTKEQTKLIAKGIAKGIAEYKKQEKSKQRERAKLQKRRRTPETALGSQTPSLNPEPRIPTGSSKLPGITASAIFLLAGILHAIRLATGTEITIGAFSVPLYWSAIAAAAAFLLTYWIFRSTQGASKQIDLK